MKTKILKPTLLITILIAVFGFNTVSNISAQEEKNLIIGTWISTDDVNLKKVFQTDGKCLDYYNGQLTTTYSFSIERTSPQCGQSVPIGNLFSYLKIVNLDDSNDFYCYEILSLNAQYLQIRWIERGGSMSFKRQ
jgi:hypothetical protein